MERIRHLIGLVVLVAAGLGGWWLVRTAQGGTRDDGYRLVVEVADARGLRAGGQVRHRGVVVGEVRGIELAAADPASPSGPQARVQVAIWLRPTARPLARINSRFWIAAPRFQGITAGVSDLDTLVRDAYLAFTTSEPAGPALATGALVRGFEDPPRDTDRLPVVESGDLLMELVVPENFGLNPGSPVKFRGLATGEVRSVELAEDGSHVLVGLRIRRDLRRTVTDAAQFWVARPNVAADLLDGIQVAEVAAILEPYVAYHAEPDQGLPVADGWRALGLAERPDLDMAPVPEAVLRARTPRAQGDSDQASKNEVVVWVSYQGQEQDLLSPDDEVKLSGSGLLYRDQAGRCLVLTARSACDGAMVVQDTFGDPEMADEEIRVSLAGGTVLRAARRWIDPAGNDVAVLELLDPPADLPVSRLAGLAKDLPDGAPEGDPWRAMAVDFQAQSLPPLPIDKALSGYTVAGDSSADWLGAPVLDASGRVVAVLGRVAPTSPDGISPQGLAGLPAAFLPTELPRSSAEPR